MRKPELVSGFVFDCPSTCGGCMCHVSPPCSHCLEHMKEECDSCHGQGAQLVSDDPVPAYMGCCDCMGTGIKEKV